jgi:hypothetical protein
VRKKVRATIDIEAEDPAHRIDLVEPAAQAAILHLKPEFGGKASGSLRLKQWVEVLEFDAGIFGCELPIGFGVMAIAIVLP